MNCEQAFLSESIMRRLFSSDAEFRDFLDQDHRKQEMKSVNDQHKAFSRNVATRKARRFTPESRPKIAPAMIETKPFEIHYPQQNASCFNHSTKTRTYLNGITLLTVDGKSITMRISGI